MPTSPIVPSFLRCAGALLTCFVGAAEPLTTETAPLAPEEIELRWVLPTDDLYAGQTFDLSLEVSTAGSAEDMGLLQLFPQPLDLSIQIEAFAGIERLEIESGDAASGPTVVVDGTVIGGAGPFIDPDDATRLLYRITRRAKAPRAGRIELPAPTARFATATSFREDFVRGRVPVDRTERGARGPSAELAVLSLPEGDRPFSFDGAIGRFELVTSVEPNAVRVGEPLRLSVLVEGAAPLDAVPAPHVDAGSDIDVLGVKRADVDGGTEFTYELVVRTADAMQTPPVTFTSFDPLSTPAGYVTVEAERLPIAVRPASTSTSTGESHPDPAAPGSESSSPDESSPAVRPRLLWTPLVLGAILAFAGTSYVRRRRARRAAQP